jgi:hypothetical protein
MLKIIDLESIIGVVSMAYRPDRDDYFLIDGTAEDTDNSYLHADMYKKDDELEEILNDENENDDEEDEGIDSDESEGEIDDYF